VLREETEPARHTPIACLRTGRTFSPLEHTRCPYCHGTEADVGRGAHEDFCDYRPGVDPPSFGRPGDADRYACG